MASSVSTIPNSDDNQLQERYDNFKFILTLRNPEMDLPVLYSWSN